ncbi:MAG: gliding motility-associated protein GldE [Saprospiraceae bacterium]|nr:gliding motility-associated protein GldE [Saprospiraceae bacterium]
MLLWLPPASGVQLIAGFAGIVLLLIGSALVSGSEVAFFSLTHNDFDALKEEKTSSGRLILYLKDRPRILLATILISNNFINISIVILSDFLLKMLLPAMLLEQWADGIAAMMGFASTAEGNSLAGILGFLITVVAVTFLLVLFGEVAPKIYATQNNLRLARMMARPLKVLSIVFGPISALLVRSTSLIERKLEQRAKAGNSTSKEDIGEAIELTVSGEKDMVRRELDILHSIVKFGGVTVKQIMTSRVDIVAVENTASYKELLEVARQSGYSRIPVYAEDLDNVAGILYVKDLLGHLQEPDQFAWQPLIRENVFYVPESKKIDELLREFQSQHLHVAIVVDEYGGTSGLVTLEDIMEEIIGDIKDEFDDESEVVFRKIDDNNYTFEGKTLLYDMCRLIGVPQETFDAVKGEADSVAGLILELHGQFPRKDAVLHYNQFTFKIVSVTKRRIEEVRITIHNTNA